MRKSGSTVTNALGVMPEFIFRTPESEFDRDHKLRTIMAVPVATEWGEAFEERFNIKFMQCYGMTEVNIICYTRDDDPLLPGMAGHVLNEFFEVRVVNPETDEVLPEGEIGEIVVRPKVPFCFGQGYFRIPERTVKAWRNLWFHTSDAGRFDEEGRLFFEDRIKDRIRRRGENISPFEIEQVLNDHPSVMESAVIGIRVEGAGGEDEVKACIVPTEGADLKPASIVEWCEARLAKFKVPRYIEFRESLPKTPTQKVEKYVLRREKTDLTEGCWDRERAKG